MRILPLILLLFAGSPSLAQHTPYNFTNYTTANGLLSDVTYSGFFDHSNYLWICSDRGISRFDGTYFRHFTTNDGLPDEEIIRALEDDNGTIWVEPFKRETAFKEMNSSVFTNINQVIHPDTVKNDFCYRIFKLKHGAVALLSQTGMIRIVKNKKWIRSLRLPTGMFYSAGFIYENDIGDVRAILQGTDIVFHPDGSYRVEPSKYRFLEYRSEQDKLCLDGSSTVVCIELTKRGKEKTVHLVQRSGPVVRLGFFGNKLVVGESSGRVTLVDWNSSKTDELDFKAIFSSATANKAGNVNVIFSANEGIFIHVDERSPVYHPLKKLPYHLYIDEGKPTILDNTYRVVFPASDSHPLGFTKWAEQRLTETVNGQSLTYGSYALLMRTRHRPEIPLNLAAVKDLYILNDSIRYVASSAGIFSFNCKRLTKDTLSIIRSTAVSPGPNGSVFIGTHWGIFEHRKNGELIDWGKRKMLSSCRITDLAYCNGVVWIATAGNGLIAIYKGKIQQVLSENNGISGNVVTTISGDNRWNVYVGYHGRAEKIHFTIRNNRVVILEQVMLKMKHYEDVKSFRYVNHQMIGIGTGGVFMIPDSYREPKKNFSIQLDKVMLNDEAVKLKNVYHLPVGDYDCVLSFSSINYELFPLKYRYRINKNEWVYTAVPEIRYTNLGSGCYQITIQVINNYYQPSDTKILTINIRKHIYLENWFLLTSGISVLLLLTLIIRRWFKQKYRKEREQLKHAHKLKELELAALKAQINPHFVFNCLNSIKALIYENKLNEADKYLNRFSRLFRNTLDNSETTFHSVQNEIDYLANYLELEQLRFKGRFEFTFMIGDGVNTSASCIPPMLLQPHVENAIKHGVAGLQDRMGELSITFSQEAGLLSCVIADNGVGRTSVTASQGNHISKGIVITTKQAQLHHIKTSITDNEPHGTCVKLTIPVVPETTNKKNGNYGKSRYH